MQDEILIRFFLAVLWGGLVGAEREYRSKSAGFRTMIMISIGSCLFTILSLSIGGGGNPDRIASNIVTGIGFLGAGVIFRGENRVNGITTAATIWAIAAVGMSIGAGHYFESTCVGVLILLVLAALPYLENLIDQFNQYKEYTVDCNYSDDKKKHFENLLREFKLRFRLMNESKKADDLSFTWEVRGHQNNHDQFIRAVMKDVTVKKFEY